MGGDQRDARGINRSSGQRATVTGNDGVMPCWAGYTVNCSRVSCGRTRRKRYQVGIKLVVAVTDHEWSELLRQKPDLTEVNFWAPSGATFKALDARSRHMPKRQFKPRRSMLSFKVLPAPAPIQIHSPFALRFCVMPYSRPAPAAKPR
jgi:hypothetical protein